MTVLHVFLAAALCGSSFLVVSAICQRCASPQRRCSWQQTQGVASETLVDKTNHTRLQTHSSGSRAAAKCQTGEATFTHTCPTERSITCSCATPCFNRWLNMCRVYAVCAVSPRHGQWAGEEEVKPSLYFHRSR